MSGLKSESEGSQPTPTCAIHLHTPYPDLIDVYASSSVLSEASPIFKKALVTANKKVAHKTQQCTLIEFDTVDPNVFSLLLDILHSNNKDLPPELPWKDFTQLAVLWEEYQISISTKRIPWLNTWKERMFTPGLEDWIWVWPKFKLEGPEYANLTARLVAEMGRGPGELVTRQLRTPADDDLNQSWCRNREKIETGSWPPHIQKHILEERERLLLKIHAIMNKWKGTFGDKRPRFMCICYGMPSYGPHSMLSNGIAKVLSKPWVFAETQPPTYGGRWYDRSESFRESYNGMIDMEPGFWEWDGSIKDFRATMTKLRSFLGMGTKLHSIQMFLALPGKYQLCPLESSLLKALMEVGEAMTTIRGVEPGGTVKEISIETVMEEAREDPWRAWSGNFTQKELMEYYFTRFGLWIASAILLLLVAGCFLFLSRVTDADLRMVPDKSAGNVVV